MTPMSGHSLEERLIERGLLRADARGPASPAANAGASYRGLMAQGQIDSRLLADEISAFHDLPRVSLERMRQALADGASLATRFSSRYLRDAGIFPYLSEAEDGHGERRTRLHLAIADPTDEAVLRTIELTLGAAASHREIAAFDDVETILRSVIEQSLPVAGAGENGDGTIFPSADSASASEEDIDRLHDFASGEPVVRAVNEMFERAVEMKASDIHIEPYRNALRVRLRVDGLLRPIPAPPAEMARAIVSRVKILAGLNIAERCLPQDGRAPVRVGQIDLDVRVATMPTSHGEGAVLRILEQNKRLVSLQRLGFAERDQTVIKHHLAAPHGLVIVTGPTGSGKTTTLASALAELNAPERKVLTIEDPVEYDIAGINQSQVRPNIGLTFATALRAFLRQDPDVIMVGEMRDTETAQIGLQASLTGHLVLTTLHTNTAAAALTRLVDLKVEPYLIGSTLRCVIGQRLVRTLCPHCKRQVRIDRAMLTEKPAYAGLGLKVGDEVGVPIGCDRCHGAGYSGRHGVFEVLEVTDTIRRLVLDRADDQTIERQARDEGMNTMIDDGLLKCRAGMTSIDEVLRVAVGSR